MNERDRKKKVDGVVKCYAPFPYYTLIHFSGDEDQQFSLRTFCTEFSDIFSNELPKEPANIPPLNIIVDNLGK